MHILELIKVLKHEFRYDYIKRKCDNKSKLSFTGTDSLMYEFKSEDVYKYFSSNNYSTKSKYFDDLNKLVIWKMENETGVVAIEQFLGLKSKMYLFLEDNDEHKKAKDVNKKVVAKIGHNEYKDVLWINKHIRHSMNRIQTKDHRIRTYEISKISSSCFHDKIYIKNNGYDGLTRGY